MQTLSLPSVTRFQWDKNNERKNEEKHQVQSRESEEIFFDKPILFYDVQHSQKEERFILLGFTLQERRLTVIFTIRDNAIRVISARDQSKKEKSIYIKYTEGEK